MIQEESSEDGRGCGHGLAVWKEAGRYEMDSAKDLTLCLQPRPLKLKKAAEALKRQILVL